MATGTGSDEPIGMEFSDVTDRSGDGIPRFYLKERLLVGHCTSSCVLRYAGLPLGQ